MLFTGQSEHTIDAKQRLAIPAKYRNRWNPAEHGGAWMCIPWPTGHLRLYTEATFEKLASQGEMSLTPDEDLAELQATLFGHAERLEMDSAGRISIPQDHLRLSGLGTEVSIVGAGDRLEVRARATWTAEGAERFRKLPSLIAKIEARRRGAHGSGPGASPGHAGG